MSKRIVMLCSDCFSTVALYNYIGRFYNVEQVIVEKPLRGAVLAKRRIKKLGFLTVSGQVLFSIVVVGFLKIVSKKRILDIKHRYQFDESPIPVPKTRNISSVNDAECINLIKTLEPDVILVNGTRILSKKLLESTSAIVINMHTGITPRYRGVHGGYWALVNKDADHCGVTVHLVDRGIDTGKVLYQARIPLHKSDNYLTYPFIQFGEGIPLVKQAIDDINNGNLKTISPDASVSKLWYHPTIWGYLYQRIARHIK